MFPLKILWVFVFFLAWAERGDRCGESYPRAENSKKNSEKVNPKTKCFCFSPFRDPPVLARTNPPKQFKSGVYEIFFFFSSGFSVFLFFPPA